MASELPLVLASASPRRAELLDRAGISFVVDPASVDESVLPGESAEAYAGRVARAKALVVHARHPGRAVLAADTVVVVDGAILGKPRDDADARRMLRLLSDRTHDVLTAVCLIQDGAEESFIARTQVTFTPLGDDEIDWYVGTGEPRDKAGAYAIQGLASRFASRIDGSYSNVVGLPVAAVYGRLRPSSRANRLDREISPTAR